MSVEKWLATRALRIVLPILTVAFTFNTIARWFILLCEGNECTFTREAWDAIPPTGARELLHHLWFLETLAILIIFFIAGIKILEMKIFKALKSTIERLLEKLSGSVNTVLCLSFVGLILLYTFMPRSLYPALRSASLYLPHFLVGAYLANNQEFLNRYVKMSKSVVILGLATLVLSCVLYVSDAGADVRLFTHVLSAFFFTRLLIAIFANFFNKSNPTLKKFVTFSLSIYLIHHPVVLIIAAPFTPLHIAPFIEFIITCAATFFISYAGAKLIHKSSASLLLFEGRWDKSWSEPNKH